MLVDEAVRQFNVVEQELVVIFALSGAESSPTVPIAAIWPLFKKTALPEAVCDPVPSKIHSAMIRMNSLDRFSGKCFLRRTTCVYYATLFHIETFSAILESCRIVR